MTLNWANTISVKPIECKRPQPYKSLRNEFIIPLKEEGTITVAEKTFSKVIVFINSVDAIVEIIKSSELDKRQCGIICGDNYRNQKKTSGINFYVSGTLPKYLFITMAGFSGIDLTDDNAVTIIASNVAKDFTMLDLMTDVQQAVSRQRNKSNPNYGSYFFIFNQTLFEKTEKELLAILDAIRTKLELGIVAYNNIYKGTGDEVYFMKDDDFDRYTLFKNGSFVINEHAFNAHKYFIIKTLNQYRTGYNVCGALNKSNDTIKLPAPSVPTFSDLVGFYNDNNAKGKVDWKGVSSNVEWISLIEESYKLFGGKVDKNYTRAKQMVESKSGDVFKVIEAQAKRTFSIGKRYSRAEAKTLLQSIYDSNNIKRKANHNDMNNIFNEVRTAKVRGENYLEIIKK